MALRKYIVTYDLSINGRYIPQKKEITASNQKEACQVIKDQYWNQINSYCDKGYAYNTARKYVRWPFHIKAEKVPEYKRTRETIINDCLDMIRSMTQSYPEEMVRKEAQEVFDFFASPAGVGLTEDELLDDLEFELTVFADNYIAYTKED